MATTVTRTVTRLQQIQRDEQFLAAELEDMEMLEKNIGKQRAPLTIVWRNVAIFTALHLGALIGLFQLIFVARWLTLPWTFLLYLYGGTGITAGAHRLWAHRCYKARLPLRVFLMIGDTIAFQNDVIEWVRDHRCHHKWTDTEADPHNSRRGFFYSHVGWLLARKTPQLKEMGAKIDLSDLFDDPVLVFQRKHYLSLVFLFSFVLPTVIPVFFWGESPIVAFYAAAVFRYAFTLNATWLINSAAHMFGYRPYDATISPVESSWTNQLAVGEGGHNFHHTFPQDYRTSEFGYLNNWTRAFIDGWAWMGLAYDLKVTAKGSIERQMAAKGDGSRVPHS